MKLWREEGGDSDLLKCKTPTGASRGLCNLRNVPAELPEHCVSGLKHSYALRMKLILYVLFNIAIM